MLAAMSEEGPVPATRSTLRHGGLALLRINLFLLLPASVLIALSCLLPRTGARDGCGELSAFLIGVFTMINTVCLPVIVFSLLPGLRREGVGWWLLLGLAILPALALLGAVLGRVALELLFPGLIHVGFFRLFLFALVVAQLCGLSLQSGAEFQARLAGALGRLDQERERQRQLRAERDASEAAALRALIEPHFLFNTLNTLASLIPEQPKRAEEVTLRLARLFRRVLESRVQEWTTLGREVEVLTDYLELERARMGERLTYTIEVAAADGALAVPSLLLQPLVENAVRHGVARRSDPGRVVVRAVHSDRGCRLEVVDDGPGLGHSSGGGHGLRLVGERLALHFGPGCGPTLERDEARGLTVAALELPAR